MSFIVAIQIDPLHTLDFGTDTSILLGWEIQNRGARIFVYHPDHLFLKEGGIFARGHFVKLHDNPDHFFAIEESEVLDLSSARYVLMRQNPPFNMAYIAATHLLERLPKTTVVINNPTSVRNAPEKLSVGLFPDLTPPTLISREDQSIFDFIKHHETVVMKPLFDFGGSGVLKLKAGDSNLKAILELYQRLYQEPLVLQKFIPEIVQGDKRIILLHGKPVGIFTRIPAKGQTRSNMRVGGTPVVCEFSRRDLEICDRIGPFLKEQGHYIAGIDVIGSYLTEINVTSPTGLKMMNRLYGLTLEKVFWNGFERGLVTKK
jgi:glutathione synthase